MAKRDITYNALTNEGNPFMVDPANRAANDAATIDTDNDETPQESGIMIHIVPEANKTRWNHIEDLDSFFARMYYYHQKHGFVVMMLQEAFELGQFVFVVLFTTFLIYGVNYRVLFREDGNSTLTKVHLYEVVNTFELSAISGFTWIALILSFLFWIFRLIKVLNHVIQYWDIKMFFNSALKIEDSELDNLTWHEVQKRIREVQSEQQMCIHKEQLTELDIYHRILRFKNYMVAMMNKNLIPAKVMVPLLGECVCLSRGLRYNIELILFRGPWSPFENNWHLKDEYKKSNRRTELSQKLSRQIMWVAVANFVLCPLVFLWQLMYFFFNYAELIKREPGTLGMRCWSQYGRLYLRHFNELDHELDARLNRAYRPAVKYMNSFSSPLMTVIAKNFAFIGGGILSVILVLTIYDEDVVQVEHIITIITLLTAVVVISRNFIPDDNLIWCPEQLMTAVLAHVHYLPVTWRGLAHTSRVRDQFGQLFQLKAIHLLNELLSPLVTPFVLYFSFRSRALEIVDFFRNFTVAVVGVGDVCSFAQMDVRKHGNTDWQLTNSNEEEQIASQPQAPTAPCQTNQYTQGEHGKTELSLVHFTMTNPQWKMPNEARQFVQGLRKHALQDLNKTRGMGGIVNNTAMAQSLISVEHMGGEYSSIIQSILQTNNVGSTMGLSIFSPPGYLPPSMAHTPLGNIHQQSQMHSRHSYDFDRMLQQNLNDGSTNPLRSTLHEISEDDCDETQQQQYGMRTATEMDSSINSPPPRSTSHDPIAMLSRSMKGALSRHEGPIEGSQEGLLYSLTGYQPNHEPVTTEFALADSCFSTLYLHEIHRRQIRRRGVRYEQSQRHLWQRPHQQQPDPPFGGGGTSHSYAAPSTSRQSPAATAEAEKTPLLGAKKS